MPAIELEQYFIEHYLKSTEEALKRDQLSDTDKADIQYFIEELDYAFEKSLRHEGKPPQVVTTTEIKKLLQTLLHDTKHPFITNILVESDAFKNLNKTINALQEAHALTERINRFKLSLILSPEKTTKIKRALRENALLDREERLQLISRSLKLPPAQIDNIKEILIGSATELDPTMRLDSVVKDKLSTLLTPELIEVVEDIVNRPALEFDKVILTPKQIRMIEKVIKEPVMTPDPRANYALPEKLTLVQLKLVEKILAEPALTLNPGHITIIKQSEKRSSELTAAQETEAKQLAKELNEAILKGAQEQGYPIKNIPADEVKSFIQFTQSKASPLAASPEFKELEKNFQSYNSFRLKLNEIINTSLNFFYSEQHNFRTLQASLAKLRLSNKQAQAAVNGCLKDLDNIIEFTDAIRDYYQQTSPLPTAYQLVEFVYEKLRAGAYKHLLDFYIKAERLEQDYGHLLHKANFNVETFKDRYLMSMQLPLKYPDLLKADVYLKSLPETDLYKQNLSALGEQFKQFNKHEFNPYKDLASINNMQPLTVGRTPGFLQAKGKISNAKLNALADKLKPQLEQMSKSGNYSMANDPITGDRLVRDIVALVGDLMAKLEAKITPDKIEDLNSENYIIAHDNIVPFTLFLKQLLQANPSQNYGTLVAGLEISANRIIDKLATAKQEFDLDRDTKKTLTMLETTFKTNLLPFITEAKKYKLLQQNQLNRDITLIELLHTIQAVPGLLKGLTFEGLISFLPRGSGAIPQQILAGYGGNYQQFLQQAVTMEHMQKITEANPTLVAPIKLREDLIKALPQDVVDSLSVSLPLASYIKLNAAFDRADDRFIKLFEGESKIKLSDNIKKPIAAVLGDKAHQLKSSAAGMDKSTGADSVNNMPAAERRPIPNVAFNDEDFKKVSVNMKKVDERIKNISKIFKANAYRYVHLLSKASSDVMTAEVVNRIKEDKILRKPEKEALCLLADELKALNQSLEKIAGTNPAEVIKNNKIKLLANLNNTIIFKVLSEAVANCNLSDDQHLFL